MIAGLDDAEAPDPPQFGQASWAYGLRHTRWVMPPRGWQGGTLVLPVIASSSVDESLRSWAEAAPRLRFATMNAPVLVDLTAGQVITNRAVPRLGQVFHLRRLQIIKEVLAPLLSASEPSR